MDDLAREIAVIRDDLTPEWDEARSERLLAGVGRLQTRRRTRRLVGASVLGATAAAVVVFSVLELVPKGDPAATLASRQVMGPAGASLQTQLNSPAAIQQPAAAVRVMAGQRVHLADGSWARMAAGSGALSVRKNEAAHVELQLERGLASFDVVPNTARTFVVDAGAVQVHVLGTVFDVERNDSHVRVSVTEGKVRVQTPQGPVFVPSGDSASFDNHGEREFSVERMPAAETPAKSEAAPRPSATRERGKRAAPNDTDTAPSVSWRSLCQSGDYDAAYRLLEHGEPVDNDPAALMDAADAARFSGHAEASAAYLRRVLREHRGSPVAALAGFTLGRVLLERLGQPSEAAEAFALARELAPSGSLAQDALAREVEAWSKAGNSHEAYQRAQQYVQSYPNGRRLRAVQIYGGLQ